MNRKSPHPAWLPKAVNTGVWLTHYTVDELEQRIDQQPHRAADLFVGYADRGAGAGGSARPSPLYIEALDADLKSALLARIEECFPYYQGSQRRDEDERDVRSRRVAAALGPASGDSAADSGLQRRYGGGGTWSASAAGDRSDPILCRAREAGRGDGRVWPWRRRSIMAT